MTRFAFQKRGAILSVSPDINGQNAIAVLCDSPGQRAREYAVRGETVDQEDRRGPLLGWHRKTPKERIFRAWDITRAWQIKRRRLPPRKFLILMGRQSVFIMCQTGKHD